MAVELTERTEPAERTDPAERTAADPGGVRANAALVAALVGGSTKYSTLRSSPPLTLRATPEGVYLVGTLGGPLGGDELTLDVKLETGASVKVRSAAASVVLPGPTHRPHRPSSTSVTLDLAGGATLDWQPEPLVVASGSDHHSRVLIRAGDGTSVIWRDEIVLGRHGEGPGSLLQHLRVEIDGSPVLCTEVGLGPRWPGWDGPVGVGAARCLGSLLVLGHGASLGGLMPVANPPGLRAAVLELEGGGLLVSALGESPRTVRCMLDDLAHGLGSRARRRS